MECSVARARNQCVVDLRAAIFQKELAHETASLGDYHDSGV